MQKQKDYKAQRLYLKLARAKTKEQRLKAEIAITEYFINKQETENKQ